MRGGRLADPSAVVPCTFARRHFQPTEIVSSDFCRGLVSDDEDSLDATSDAFEVLRYYRDEERQFDAVVLDPPKFATSQGQVDRACRGYKDLNWLALRLLRPGGLLVTFSCSGLVSADLFQKVVFGAAVDARRDVQILQHLGQSTDHPVLLSFPESAYLKGLLCRVW